MSFQILRDGVHQAESHRGVEAARGDHVGGGEGADVQVGVPVHLRLGDQGPLGQGARVLPGDGSQRKQIFYTFSQSIILNGPFVIYILVKGMK